MIIAKRYAEALFQLAQDRNNLESVSESFIQLMERIYDQEGVFKVLSYPVVDLEEKMAMADELTKDLSVEVRNFIKVAIDSKRIKYLEEIYEYFKKLVRAKENRTLCEVTTTAPLDEDEITQLHQALHNVAKGEVEIKSYIDKSIIGGIIVQIGDKVYDYSLKGQLNNIREQLQKTTITS